jgi:hypothetical protein
MVASLSLNPVITTNASGSFSITLDGLMQGMAEDDPAVRFQLTGGQLASTETVPMFGGIPIGEYLTNPANVDSSLKTSIQRSISTATCTGISVFNQDHAMINTPQSPVPQALSGMLVNLYRNGSNARIPMAMDPAMIASLPALIISPTALYWDPTNQRVSLVTTGGNWALPTSYKVIGWNAGGSMTVSYNAGTGFATWVRNGNCILVQI